MPSLFNVKLATARWWKFVLDSWLRKWLVSGWLWILRLFACFSAFIYYVNPFSLYFQAFEHSHPLIIYCLALDGEQKKFEGSKKQRFFEHVEKGNNLLLFSKFCSQCKVRVLAGYVRRERKRNNGTFIAHSLHVFYPFFMYARSLVWTHHYSNTLTYNHAGEKK